MFTAFRYDVKAGNAPDAFGAAIVMDTVTKFIMIECWDNALYIQLSYDSVPTWGDTIEIDQESPPILLPLAVKQIRVQNKTAGSVSRYQVLGMG